MKTRTSGLMHNVVRLQSMQVRLSTLRLRGSHAVYVASVAAPSPRSSDSALHSFEQLSTWEGVHSNNRLRNMVQGTVDSVPISVVTDTASSLSSEHAAKLERAASSGRATTSSFVEPSPALSRKRFGNAAVKGASPASASGSGDGSRGSAPTARSSHTFQPRRLTFQISNASSIEELQDLLEEGRQNDMNAIHIATLWTRLAKLVSEPLPPPPAAESHASAPEAAGTSSSNSYQLQPWAAAAPQRPELPALAAFVNSMEAVTTVAMLADMAPRGLANLVWAAAKLKCDGADPSRLANSSSAGVAALTGANGDVKCASTGGAEQAVAGVRGGMQWGNVEAAPASASTSELEADAEAKPLRVRGGKKALEAAAAAAAAKAEAEAAASGRQSSLLVSEALLEAWAVAAGSKLSEFSMQDISNVFWALGRLGYQPQGMFMTRLCIALLKELPRANRPQQISNVLLGLALLRFTPPIKDFWPPMWEKIGSLVLGEQKEKPDVQGVTNTLWALSHLRRECPNSMPMVPALLVSKAVFRAVKYGNYLSGPQCQDVFVSLPQLGFRPSSDYQASRLLAVAGRVIPRCDGQALSNILVSLVHLRVAPWSTWKTTILKAFEKQLPHSSPEAIARFLFAWAHMRMPPPMWAPQVWKKLHREVHTLTATDVAFVVLGANQQFERLSRRAQDAPAQDAGLAAASTVAATDRTTDSPAPSSASPSEVEAAGLDAAVLLRRRRRGKAKSAEVPGVKVRVPPRQFLLALRKRWEELGPEAQLKVVFGYRAAVQDFFSSLDA
ncbi:hypothetical protein VaNZ11_015514 [Volvox africanus]|uniref:RAP domain-containing protein n=1 Tax=Volvox africanus TaxID=51714 RepID=A0ABQ5SLV5_9CHLO|nr:hypothetical protein VaNZ11_015514 [Volvox africanus]